MVAVARLFVLLCDPERVACRYYRSTMTIASHEFRDQSSSPLLPSDVTNLSEKIKKKGKNRPESLPKSIFSRKCKLNSRFSTSNIFPSIPLGHD